MYQLIIDRSRLISHAKYLKQFFLLNQLIIIFCILFQVSDNCQRVIYWFSDSGRDRQQIKLVSDNHEN